MKEYVTGLQHIGIPTNDLKKSVEFYKGLGFENIYQVKNGTETVAFLRYENLTLEVYENGAALERDGSIDHIALDAKNVDGLFEKMKEAGYTMLTQEVNSLPFWENGIRYFIIEGPNKERIEFCERL